MPPSGRELPDDDPDPLPGLGRSVDDSRSERLAGKNRLRSGHRLADHVRHVDFVRQAVRGVRGPRVPEVLDRPCVAAVPVVQLEPPVAVGDVLRRRVRHRRRREALGRVAQVGECALHEALPDQSWEGAARDGLAVELVGHRPRLVRVADPNRRHELRCVADEPGVAVVLGRPGLPRGGTPARKRGRLAGPVPDHVLQQRGDDRGVFLRQRLDGPGRVVVDRPPLVVRDLDDHARLVAEPPAVDPLTAVGEGRERARHLERVDALGAEPDRKIRQQPAPDPERPGRVRDVLRADELRQLREDGVVRVRSRLLDRDRAEVLVLVVVDLPEPTPGIDRHLLGDEGRARCNALLQRGRKHEGLEGGARLPLALHGEIELALAEVVAAEHGEDAAVARIDRHQRRRRAGRVREPLPDRVPGHLLELEIDRRVDLQSAAEDAPRPVTIDQLLFDVVREVLRRSAVARELDLLPVRQLLVDRVRVVGLRDVALVAHLA